MPPSEPMDSEPVLRRAREPVNKNTEINASLIVRSASDRRVSDLRSYIDLCMVWQYLYNDNSYNRI
jgi:hypothetical protein